MGSFICVVPEQALLHAPLLRNFYLGGGHSRALCSRRQHKPCLSCELVRAACLKAAISLRPVVRHFRL